MFFRRCLQVRLRRRLSFAMSEIWGLSVCRTAAFEIMIWSRRKPRVQRQQIPKRRPEGDPLRAPLCSEEAPLVQRPDPRRPASAVALSATPLRVWTKTPAEVAS